jgi:hypothetical protein
LLERVVTAFDARSVLKFPARIGAEWPLASERSDETKPGNRTCSQCGFAQNAAPEKEWR